jgi:Mor family transcriptional regulator
MNNNTNDEKLVTIHTYIRKANNQEITELVELIKIRKETLSKEKMNAMEVGDKVFFISKGSKITGTIRKKNIKRLVVDTEQGGWNIPASMLTLA